MKFTEIVKEFIVEKMQHKYTNKEIKKMLADEVGANFSELEISEIKNNILNEKCSILKEQIDLQKSKFKIAEQALNDIIKWDDILEDKWSDQGHRANNALEKIMVLEGF